MDLDEFREEERRDPNLFWRLASGDHLNLLEEAIDRMDAAEGELAIWRQAGEGP